MTGNIGNGSTANSAITNGSAGNSAITNGSTGNSAVTNASKTREHVATECRHDMRPPAQ